MRDRMSKYRHRAASFLLLGSLCASLDAQEERRTYAIRAGDKIVGYQTETETQRTENGRAVVDFVVKSLAKIEVLGSSFDQDIRQTWTLDAKTRAVLRVDSRLSAGTVETAVRGELRDDGFVFWAVGDEARPTVVDPASTVISPDYAWLLQRAPAEIGKRGEVRWFMPEFGQVGTATVTRTVADREVDALGSKQRADGFAVSSPQMGTDFVVFVTRGGDTLRYEIAAMSMVVDLASPSVVERLQRIDVTNTIVCKTNLDLDDPTPLTFLKVRVRVDATSDVTFDSLNAPGQTFVGTVTDGRVDGVFEICTKRPDGAGAPPFPPPVGTFAAAPLQPYLQPSRGIESDDPVIVAKARELAVGASTCFEVVERLAKWTHENIAYAIPGGVTAKRTMELRQGDCGGHSNVLAAMLRSVGIPTRTSMGGMYVPLHGGSFGQHMWNEVWLGDVIGWMPVDCTVGQATFVDASHIRLAEGVTAFRPHLVEVLAWEPKSAAGPAAAERRTDPYPWQPGESTTWSWRIGTTDLGTEQMTYEGLRDGEHVFTSVVDFAGSRFGEKVRTVVGADGSARSLHVERSAQGKTSWFEVRVDGTKATIDRKGGEEDRSDEVDLPAGVFLLHNNCTVHFAIVLSRIGALADGVETKVRVVHDEVRAVLPISLRGAGAATCRLGDVEVPARRIEGKLGGLDFEVLVDDHGRLLRFCQKQGDVVVERTPH